MRRVALRLGLPEGTWQVHYYGAMTWLKSNPRIRAIHAYFRSLDRQRGRLQKQPVSMMHALALPIGRIVEGGGGALRGTVALPGGRRVEATLDLSPANTRFVRRSQLGIATRSPVIEGLLQTPDYESLLLRVDATDAAPAALIPCITLFQLFWGFSSRTADVVLSGKIQDPEQFVFNPERTGWHDVDGERVYKFWLREKMLDADARCLAAWCCNPTGLAAGQAVWKSLAVQEAAGRSPVLLTVPPPWQGEVHLSGFGHVIQTDAGPSVLFTHVTECDFTAPWDRLSWDRDNDNRPGSQDQPGEPKLEMCRDRRPIPKPLEPDTIALTEEVAGQQAAEDEVEAIEDLPGKFPGLLAAPAEKAPQPETTYRHAPGRAKLLEGDRSAIEVASDGDKGVVSATLVGDLLDEEEEPEVEGCQEPLHVQLAEFVDDLQAIGEVMVRDSGADCRVQVRFVDPFHPSSHPERVFRLPAPPKEAEQRAWWYRDPGMRATKWATCAVLTLSLPDGTTRSRIVVDTEPRRRRSRTEGTSPSSGSSFFVVWTAAGAGGDLMPVSTESVVATIKAVALKGNPRLAARPRPHLAMGCLKHTGSLPPRLAQRIFDAADTFEGSPDAPVSDKGSESD